MYITEQDLRNLLIKLFLKYGFQENKATLLAHVFTESSLAGVNSHGVNRVPLFLEMVTNKIVKLDADPEKKESFGNLERWDGNLGPGIINASKCTQRAVELAKLSGMGLVALRNTNHWMRGGTYGWQAAEAGCIGLMFTNTKPNMPPWGGKDSRIGNNPLVISIPRSPHPIVLDMALSQFAFGKIHNYKLKGKKLPFPGGWDNQDNLSNDPEEILAKERGLPIGYWKGSALSIMLDMLATLLSAGNSTFRIGQKEPETGISQIFLCIYPEVFDDKGLQQKLINEIIDYTQDVEPIKHGERTFYPGEQSAKTKLKNMEQGIPVDDGILEEINTLLGK